MGVHKDDKARNCTTGYAEGNTQLLYGSSMHMVLISAVVHDEAVCSIVIELKPVHRKWVVSEQDGGGQDAGFAIG